MSNPYQSPAFNPQQFKDAPFQSPIGANDYGWVSQVRIVAILNGVQGALEIPMGALYVGMAFFIPTVIEAGNANQQGPPPPKEMLMFLTGTYLVMGIPVLLSGILRILAAFRNFQFRSRTLGIVSLVLGVVSMLGCYCAPTSIALLVYGLIVYLNPAVKVAFAMGDEGIPAGQILATFVPYRNGPQFPPPGAWPPPKG